MPVKWDELFNQLDDAGKEMLSVLKPYLPALAREGPDIFEGFIKHLNDQDFVAIDKLMYEKMTLEERRALEDAVYKDAVEAAKARYRRGQLMKDIGFKLVLRLLMMVALG